MMHPWIQNKRELATTPEREIVLEIIEAGFEAINTESVVKSSVLLENNILKINEIQYNLADYQNIYVIGIGKVAPKAAMALEQVLGDKITDGVVIGLHPAECKYIRTYGASHPTPTKENVELGEKVIALAKKVTKKDLVVIIVSGGGSSLLCWPEQELEQSIKLYNEFLKSGGSIFELNTVRKHISGLKGGGLLKELYPATVVGLIFSDVPGDRYEYIASGPTYKDSSTVKDAEDLIEKYKLSTYELRETPKEDKYFVKVTNIALVSNLHALEAMARKTESLGLNVRIISSELYDGVDGVSDKFLAAAKPGTVVLGGGEPQVIVTRAGGTGGRSQRLGTVMLPKMVGRDVFAAVASDGLDNGPYAGVIQDASTLQKMKDLGLDYNDYFNRFDSEGFYNKLAPALLTTGPTHANISDFMLLYRP